ncbi:tetratricopeptide repeat protein [Telmatobacter sp. DSM 110680]|uniref:Tetratricopeptide repeat protein n=2 Tax=Telmatobacter sp. DSM 110680 TaxID=3036704 RepID=A0AAU7DIW3_9BACT
MICCALLLIATCAGECVCQEPADPLAQERSLVAAGKLGESESALMAYLNTNPSSADAHFLLGYVLFSERKAKESLAEFTAGAKFRRPRPDELKVVASDYVMLGDFGDADKWFSEVVAEAPDDADANYLLGRTKFNENDFPAAISSFERALALHPKYVEAENNIGLAWRELNDLAKAKAAFQTAIDWQGDAPADAQPFLNMGTLLVDQNKTEEAAPFLAKAAVLSPQNPTIHEELSHVYSVQRDLPKAQSELERAIALAPDISSLHFKLGQIYRQEGMRDRAREQFDICAKLSGAHSSEKTPNPISIKTAPDR